MLELFPGGFEERDADGRVELVAYAGGDDEARMRSAFDDVSAQDVAEGWEDRWREFHRGVRVGELWVGPPWLEAPARAIPVVIEPGRAFGTGAHPTTRLCLEALARMPHGSLLDVGCGSGVLAVAGCKLGFAPVFALDDDSAAVAATKANAAVNGVDVDAFEADALTDALPAADTTVANITLEAIRELSPRVTSRDVVTSGYLATDELALEGWSRLDRAELEGWAADVWRRAGE
ncbi:MAG TPA: 50S ribosomal protein L11 methyltransferase [Gaiellaceae bacterium]|nr:50S ribosomal protein L11 methyltransferase [Gaiellaceae bacterium]